MNYQPTTGLLNNRIILVTGASDGIGKEAALTYARHGASVILLGRNETKLIAVKEEIKQLGLPEARYFLLDFADASHQRCAELANQLAQQITHLDGVLHNAGILGDRTPMIEQNPEHWQSVMQINVNVTFYLTQALLPLLLKAKSASLIFTSSGVGHQGRANWGAYSVSKFATEGMMQVLADEYKETGLRVNCINPGGTRTAMRADAFPTEDPLQLKTPADIMPLYLWLMGDDSLHETGKTFDAQPKHQLNVS